MDKFGRGASLAAVLATLAITCAVAHAEGDAPPPRNARLGIAIAYLDENWREANSYRSSGVMVVGVDPRGRAAKSGIVAGDVLVSVAGRTMREPSDLGYAERTLLSGEAVSVVLARDGGKSIKIFDIAPLGATPVAPAEGAAALATPPAASEPAAGSAEAAEQGASTTSADTAASPSSSASAKAVAAAAAAAGAAASSTDADTKAESKEAASTATESPAASAPRSGGSSAGPAALGAAAVVGATAAKAAPDGDAPADATATTNTEADSSAKPAASGTSASEQAATPSTTTATDVAGSTSGAGGAASNGAPVAAAAGVATLSAVSGSEPAASATPTIVADEGDSPAEGDKLATTDLGVRGQPLSPDFATALGATGVEGVLVLEVIAASPADRAGVRAGDIIVKVGEQPVSDMDEFLRAAGASPIPVPVATRRLGKQMVALVSFDGPPPAPAEPPTQEQLLHDLRDEVRSLRREVQGLRKKLGK